MNPLRPSLANHPRVLKHCGTAQSTTDRSDDWVGFLHDVGATHTWNVFRVKKAMRKQETE